MKMMQTRYDMPTTKLLIKALEQTPPDALTPGENIAAAELAAKLRWRAVRLWGADYERPAASELAGQLAMHFAETPLEQMP